MVIAVSPKERQEVHCSGYSDVFNSLDLQLQEVHPGFIVLWVGDAKENAIDCVSQVMTNYWH